MKVQDLMEILSARCLTCQANLEAEVVQGETTAEGTEFSLKLVNDGNQTVKRIAVTAENGDKLHEGTFSLGIGEERRLTYQVGPEEARSVRFTIAGTDLKDADLVCKELGRDLGIRSVEMDSGLAKVSVVGVGMKTHTGVAAKMFNALAAAEINIQNITTSEIVVSCVVNAAEGEKAVQVLHAEFELDKAKD